MNVERIVIFMTNGLEVEIMPNKEQQVTQAQVNQAFQALENKQPYFVIDAVENGRSVRGVYKVDQICFYRVEFAKPLESADAFINRVTKRLQEVEFNHNVKTIVFSKEDFDRVFQPLIDDNKNPQKEQRFLGREIGWKTYLNVGEMEMISDKGEVI